MIIIIGFGLNNKVLQIPSEKHPKFCKINPAEDSWFAGSLKFTLTL